MFPQGRLGNLRVETGHVGGTGPQDPVGESQEGNVMCDAASPAGNLCCARDDCDGRGHVWIHASSAHDDKAD